jgi:hypothetical protein
MRASTTGALAAALASMAQGSALVAIATASMAPGCATARPPRARVALRCADPGAEVTVDGVPRGLASDYTGGPGKQLLLPAGEHRLVVRAADGAQSMREVTVGPEDSLTVAVDLAPARAVASNEAVVGDRAVVSAKDVAGKVAEKDAAPASQDARTSRQGGSR